MMNPKTFFFISRKQLYVLAGGLISTSYFLWVLGSPSDMVRQSVAAICCLNSLNCLRSVHECDRRQTDRQTCYIEI